MLNNVTNEEIFLRPPAQAIGRMQPSALVELTPERSEPPPSDSLPAAHVLSRAASRWRLTTARPPVSLLDSWVTQPGAVVSGERFSPLIARESVRKIGTDREPGLGGEDADDHAEDAAAADL